MFAIAQHSSWREALNGAIDGFYVIVELGPQGPKPLSTERLSILKAKRRLAKAYERPNAEEWTSDAYEAYADQHNLVIFWCRQGQPMILTPERRASYPVQSWDLERIGKFIGKIRREKGLSLERLADQCKTTEYLLNRLEKGLGDMSCEVLLAAIKNLPIRLTLAEADHANAGVHLTSKR